MAEEQKEKKTSGIDSFFGGLEDGLKKAARGESNLLKSATLGLVGGDKEIAEKVEKLNIDKVVAFPGTFLERTVLTPLKAVASIDAGIQYVGTRIGSSLSARRRFAAQSYLKPDGGPWGKKGLIYGNADRIAESSPAYEAAYLGERASKSKRQEVYTSGAEKLKAEIKLNQKAGNRVGVMTKQAELRDLKRRKKNVALSVARVAAYEAAVAAGNPPPPKDALDDANVALDKKRTELDAQRATFLPKIPIFKQMKRRRMERAVRHKERKTNLAKNILAN